MSYKLLVIAANHDSTHMVVIDFASRREADIGWSCTQNRRGVEAIKLYEESTHERSAASRRNNRETGRTTVQQPDESAA